MVDRLFVGLFLYIGGRADALARLASYFGVLPGRLTNHGQGYVGDGVGDGVDDADVAAQANAIRWSAVNGDFIIACDVDLFEWTPTQIKARLSTLSMQGVTIAMPDEGSPSPQEFWLFENGGVKKAVILQDDDTDTVTIWRGEPAA